MRQMVLRTPEPIGGRPLLETEGADSAPARGQVAIAVRGCAVCRTDLQIVEGDVVARRLPIVPGHQIVGVIDAIGSDVRGWSRGDRVGVGWLAGTCGVCRYCTTERENLCERATFTGWDVDGGYATRTLANAEFVFRLPDAFDDLHAAPLLCGGVIGYRALKRARVEPGQRIGLYGFGASAFLSLQVARHWGCRVFVATRSTSERARAMAMGAVWAGGYDEHPPEPLDAAVTFAPVGDVVVAALSALARGGTVAVNAIHLDRIPAFSYDLLWWERSVVSVANYTRKDAVEFLELAAEIPLETRFETHALTAANDALSRLRAGAVSGSAVLETARPR